MGKESSLGMIRHIGLIGQCLRFNLTLRFSCLIGLADRLMVLGVLLVLQLGQVRFKSSSSKESIYIYEIAFVSVLTREGRCAGYRSKAQVRGQARSAEILPQQAKVGLDLMPRLDSKVGQGLGVASLFDESLVRECEVLFARMLSQAAIEQAVRD